MFIFFTALNLNFAQTEIPKAQANFIYNFTKFFDWPQSEKSGDFVIGVIGSRMVYSDLEKVTTGKRNITQNIVVKYFKSNEEVTKCHVLFVSALKSKSIEITKNKYGDNCLIISDSRSSIQKGASIQFIIDDDRLRYKFSEENAKKNNLKFHSKVSAMSS